MDVDGQSSIGECTASGYSVREKKNRYRKYAPLLMMMVPGLLYLLFNNYLPMLGIAIAFKKSISLRVCLKVIGLLLIILSTF